MLIYTAGAIDANSFISLVDANLYHIDRLHNAEWANADDTTKETALKMATRLLNNMSWKGSIASYSQKLKFPRYGLIQDGELSLTSVEIPQFLKDATAEYAFLLIIKDSTRESSSKGFKSIKVAVISLVMDASDRSSSITNSVLEYIQPYLKSSSIKEVYKG